jgi:hypothetical protein
LAENRLFLIVMAILLGVVVALLPVARLVDDRVDRGRPMYMASQRVAFLEYRNIEQHGAPVPLDVATGDTTTLGEASFTPPSGTSLTVKAYGQGFCVKADNRYGETTGWQCWPAGVDPRGTPGSSPHAGFVPG